MHGALGKMGQAVSAGLQREPDIVIAAAVDVAADGGRFVVLRCRRPARGVRR